MSGDHPNYCITEIGQNTEKSPGDLGKFVVTQTPESNHQLTLVRKTLKREQMIMKISSNKLGEMTRKHTNNWMQEKQNNVDVKYGQENITKKPNG